MKNEHSAQVSYWQRTGLSVREGYKMHRKSGQLAKGPDSWRNVPQHCLVQVARTEVLGNWVDLPGDIIADMKMGSILHDFSKKQEIEVTKKANESGESPITAIRVKDERDEIFLKHAGFNDRVRRLADSTGGLAPQLLETDRLLDQPSLSDDDWAYLIIHYVDDCSIGSDWVKLSEIEENGRRVNILDYRERGLRINPNYDRISVEVTEELAAYPKFSGMDNFNVWSMVSRRIEQSLAGKINEVTGETIDPYMIPELVDQKIRQAIEAFHETPRRANSL